MKNIIVYSTPTCIYCRMLKDWLGKNNISFVDYDLSADVVKRDEIIEKTGQMGVPIIEIDNEFIIGFDKKKLSELLEI
ncbi:MAG: NrdH-redoxin [Candidatus Parcubacteria bacterium]|nr:NrdH-redoxin [Candidatus Parcubacteria bacterium]